MKKSRSKTNIRLLLAKADKAYNEGLVLEASVKYKLIYARYPQTRDIERKLGVTLRDQGHLSDATQLLRLAVGRNPNSAKARIDLALAYFQSGDHVSAQRYAEDALRLDRSKKIETEALYALGEIHFAQGNHGLAQDFYDAAIAANPSETSSYLGLAGLLMKLGQPLLAEYQLEQALKQDSEDESVKQALKTCRKELAQYVNVRNIHPLLLLEPINQRPM